MLNVCLNPILGHSFIKDFPFHKDYFPGIEKKIGPVSSLVPVEENRFTANCFGFKM